MSSFLYYSNPQWGVDFKMILCETAFWPVYWLLSRTTTLETVVCASLDDSEHSAKCRWCSLSYQGNFVLVLPTDTGLPALSPPVAGTFSCTMKFTVRDCDPDTGVPTEEGYDDEYVVSVACRDIWTSLHHWLLPEENIFLGTSDMKQEGFIFSHYNYMGLD